MGIVQCKVHMDVYMLNLRNTWMCIVQCKEHMDGMKFQ